MSMAGQGQSRQQQQFGRLRRGGYPPAETLGRRSSSQAAVMVAPGRVPTGYEAAWLGLFNLAYQRPIHQPWQTGIYTRPLPVFVTPEQAAIIQRIPVSYNRPLPQPWWEM